MPYRNFRLALVIPCYNEGVTIHKVVRDFRAAIAQLHVFVFDNLSSDGLPAVQGGETARLFPRLVLLGFLSLAWGLILDTVTMGRIETKRLAYLQLPSITAKYDME